MQLSLVLVFLACLFVLGQTSLLSEFKPNKRTPTKFNLSRFFHQVRPVPIKLYSNRKSFDVKVYCSEALAKCPARVPIERKPLLIKPLEAVPVSLSAQCASKKGAFDPNTGHCFVLYSGSIDWVSAWKSCRAKKVGGRKGVLAQPKSRNELDVLEKYINGIKELTKDFGWLFVGFRNVETNKWNEFYFPAVGDNYEVDTSQDHHILKTSKLWIKNEPNNKDELATLDLVLFMTFNSQSITYNSEMSSAVSFLLIKR